jgi:hypothetical protein
VAISGATDSTYTRNNVTLADAGNLSVQVSNVTGSTSVASSLGVVGIPSATDTTVLGAIKTLSVTAAGPALSYQWRRGGNVLSNGGRFSGVNTNTLTISGVTAADDSASAGSYECFVSSNGSTPIGAGGTALTVRLPPQVLTAPASLVVLVGDPHEFSVQTADPTGVSYQWKKGGASISGATNSSYNRASSALGDAGTYTVTMTNSAGSTDASANLGVAPRAPNNAIVAAGSALVLNAGATGPGLTYQWRKNGVPLSNGGRISGANSAQLVISNTSDVDEGNYEVLVSVTGSTPTSTGSTAVSVVTAPVVADAPSSVVVVAGSPATFAVAPTESAGMSYQWRKGAVNIPGATSSIYTKSGTALADAGSYTVTLTNLAGTTSSSANLGVVQPAPGSINAVRSDTAILNCTAAGVGLTYQWRRNGVPLSNGGRISGVNGPQLTITGLSDPDGGSPGYECFVSVTGSQATSAGPTVVNVIGAPAVAVGPGSQIFYAGEAMSLTVEPENPLGISYVWRKAGSSIAGAITATYSKANSALTDAGNYSVTLTNAAGVASASANVGIGERAPLQVPTTLGATSTISINAAGAGLSYQWYQDGVPLSDGGNISGVTTRSLTITGVTANDAASTFECYVQITGSTPISAGPSSLRILSVPAVAGGLGSLNAPQNQILFVGDTLELRVVPSDPLGITYQWRKGGVAIPGATSDTYRKTDVQLADAGVYSVVLTNLAGSLTASANVAVVQRSSEIAVINSGGTLVLNANATGPNLTYQWYRNGVALVNGGRISGATGPTLTVTGVSASDFSNAAGEYEVRITIPGVSQPQSLGPITVNQMQPPSIATALQDRIVLTGTEVTFTAVPVDTSTLTYAWSKNGTVIAGATQVSYTKTVGTLAEAGTYSVRMSNAAGNISDDAVLIVVQRAPIRVNAAPGATLVMNAAFSGPQGTTARYQWTRNGTPLANGGRISGAATNQLAITGFSPADASPAVGNYQCVITLNGTPVSAGETEVLMLTPPTLEVDGGLNNGTAPGVGYTVGIPLVINFVPNTANRWLITNLPPGLSYNPLTGQIYGTPTRAVTDHPVYVTAYNAAGSTQTILYLTIVPFPQEFVGSYDGLLGRHPAATANSNFGGEITVTISATGVMTGRLMQGMLAKSYPFTGKVEIMEDGRAGSTFTVPVSGGTPLTFTYVLDPEVGQISGTLTQPGTAGWNHSIEAWKRIYSASNPPTGFVGMHNYWLEPPGELPVSMPQGCGAGTVSIARDGKVTIYHSVDKDLTEYRYIRTPYLLAGGRIPLQLISVQNRNVIHGWFVITDQAGPALNILGGNMQWYAERSWYNLTYRTGFDIGIATTGPLTVYGGEWIPIARGAPYGDIGSNVRLEYTGASVELSRSVGNLRVPFSLAAASASTTAQRATFPSGNPAGYKFTIDPATGRIYGTASLMEGSVKRPITVRAYYSGALQRGGGYFRLPLLPMTYDSRGLLLYQVGFVELRRME